MKKLYNRNKELEDYHQSSLAKQNSQLDKSGATSEKENTSSKYYGSPTTDSAQRNNSVEILSEEPGQKLTHDFSPIDIKDHQNDPVVMMTDFRRREGQLESELKQKDEEIRKLREQAGKSTSAAVNGFQKSDEDHSSAYVKFIEQRLNDCLAENQRYHAKYADMREFAYTQIESLMRQLNSKKRNAIQNSNMHTYKQLFDKERKNWVDEREKTDQKVIEMQSICSKQEITIKRSKEENERLREELKDRDQCEAKVQEYVQTLIAKNEELQQHRK